MICHTDGCPASSEYDEFERRMSVQIDNRTQCGLRATGHHLINRVYDGTIDTHIAEWSKDQIARAYVEVATERDRAREYLARLNTLAESLAQAY